MEEHKKDFIKGLGEHTKIGGSILVMAIVGGVVFTPLMGWILEYAGSMAIAMCIPLLAYMYILYFSINRRSCFSLKFSNDSIIDDTAGE